MVTVKHQYGHVRGLSNGVISNDLEWRLAHISTSNYLMSNNYKMILQDRAIVTMAWQTDRKSCYDLSTGAIFTDLEWSLIQNWRADHYSTTNISKTVKDRHSYNEMTYTRLTQRCHFEWPWVILSDSAKCSMTRSIARPLCDSWASCYYTCRINCRQS